MQERNTSLQQAADGQDFRDHIPTADQQGKRIWIYPRQPRGAFYRWRTYVSYVLLIILFAGPFVRINGNPLLMMNFVERKFVVFGQVFWPQDMFLFALAMLVIFIMIVLSTAVYGRLWCGWLCPQTVLMELVFRKIEYWIEGDHLKQVALDKAPWTGEKMLKKSVKHLVFFALSFVIGNLLLAYVIGSDRLIEIITDDPRNHVKGLTAMILFSLLFYGIFARFREQACTFICPYGRFQSVLLDDNSIVVAYDYVRGENRGRFSRKESRDERRASGRGDCVDCRKCVDVCPTGIDIRDGIQMECVHCTACIDACDSVMTRLDLPTGLIRYASANGIAKKEKLRVTPRLMIYTAVLVLLTGLLSILLMTRTDVDTTLLRAPGTLFQELPTGEISNLYLIKVTNKTSRDIPIHLKLEQGNGSIEIAGGQLVAKAEQLSESAVIVKLPRSEVQSKNVPIQIDIYGEEKPIEKVRTTFLGPGRQ